MAGSDQIEKLKERNEQLQKQLEGSKKKVSDLQAKLKRTRVPPPVPKDGPGPDRDTGELQKKVEQLTAELGKREEDLRLAREERDEFAQQLQALREKLITSVGSPPTGGDEPEYDPETKKYKLSWMGDSLKDVGKKKQSPPAPAKDGAGPRGGKPEEKKADEEEIEETEETEETESYPLEELQEKAREPMEDSDVAMVTSESGGQPVLRTPAVVDDEPAEPTFKEPEESLAAESYGEEVDEQAEIMTEEKVMVPVPSPPPDSRPEPGGIKKVFSDHRALILKSLLFLIGAGLGVGLALLIFLGPDNPAPPGGEALDGPVDVPEEPKPDPGGAAKPDTKMEAARPREGRAPAELVEPIYKDAAIMDKQEAGKIGAALKVFVDKYPQDPLLRYHYARSLFHQGDVPAAIAQLEETMKMDPDMPKVHYMLGGIYLRMGDEKKAHEALDNFTRLTGKSDEAENQAHEGGVR